MDFSLSCVTLENPRYDYENRDSVGICYMHFNLINYHGLSIVDQIHRGIGKKLTLRNYKVVHEQGMQNQGQKQ